ncbi:hypothetical protein BJX96DRAFT_183318 [Aspergillus floccosus]
MAYDCYCAICGVGFCGMHIETPSHASLERRQRWIEKRYRAMEASRNKNNCQVPHDPSEDHDDPVRSYDPRIVGWDNISWLYKAYCLGSNQQPSGKTKIQHHHRPETQCLCMVWRPDSCTANAINLTSKSYGSGSGDTPGPVIPFHWCCLEILARALTGSPNPDHVDMEVLYAVMMDLCNMSGSALHLSYGDEVQESQGRYWECIPGAEASRPLTHPDVGIFLTMIVQIVTQHNYFWEKAVQYNMPWLWEFHALKHEKTLPEDINYKRLYLWLDKMTAPRYGMDDLALTGVANRRRIWGVCQQLAPRYFRGLKQAQKQT